MEDIGDPHLKRERPAGPYGQPPHLHMPPSDPPHLHNYHHHTPQSAHMPQLWNPAPSPYHDGSDHRPPPTEAPPLHQPPPAYPPQSYPPPSQSQTPTYPPDPAYSRQNSISGPPTRSPSSAQPPHYPAPVNGGPPPEGYYQNHDYRSRPSYPPESPASAPPPALHVSTNHEMMSGHPQGQPPPGYGPPPHSAGPPPAQHYWPPPPGDWYQQQRRKPVRAAQACDSCRQRKAKCDEGRPECTHCKENGLRCTYRDVPPQKSEKQMLQMGEKVDALSDRIEKNNEEVNSQFGAMDDKLNALLTTIKSLVDGRDNEIRTPGSAPMTRTKSKLSKEDYYTNTATHNANLNAPFHRNDLSLDDMGPVMDNAETNAKGRGPMGASDLLAWPSIKELAPPNIPPSYVMEVEAERGLLRLYGCGEGEDKGDGHDGVPSPSVSSQGGRMDEDSSTSSPSGVWGTGQFPSRIGGEQPVYDHAGGVTPGGELLLDQKAVDTYVQSYLDRMHILHPFLDPRVLRRMVQAFKAKHSWDYKSNPRLHQSFAAGSKRKRESSESPSSIIDEPLLHTIPHHNMGTLPNHGAGRSLMRSTQPIEHSISNAIILLVIALGKICAWDKPLPGPPKSSSVTSGPKTAQPHFGYGDLPPMPPSSAPASPYTQAQLNGQSATPGSATLHGKNMDVIPGLAYFAKAADILGELPGGVDVSHVQANLLAGLYMGQLARIFPSHWYISNACKACQILIRSPEYKNKTMPAERRNLINFAFWSCLQLESDILAEMDIPSSGIIHKEASMLLEIPTALTIADPENEDPSRNHTSAEFLRHYSNQIQLRRTINDAVHNIYNAEREQNKPTKLIDTLTENLENWRGLLREWDWNDNDHESPDINQARMRGKYYGAKYIINRPALHYALHLPKAGTPMSQPSESPHGGSQSEHTSPAISHHGNPVSNRRVNEMRPPARTPEVLEPWILKACQVCVGAAIKSTTAFDKVPQRLVITNILGTAHAQFGNVLVLAATFNSSNPQLRSLVPENTLRFLLLRTIRFLEDKAAISPALGKDADILRHVQSRLFPSSSYSVPQPVSTNSSFSSNH